MDILRHNVSYSVYERNESAIINYKNLRGSGAAGGWGVGGVVEASFHIPSLIPRPSLPPQSLITASKLIQRTEKKGL